MIELKVGTLPSNDYAFRGNACVMPQVFKSFYNQNKGNKNIFVKLQNNNDMKSALFKLEAMNPKQATEKGLTVEHCALSNFQRDLLYLSKNDSVTLKYVEVIPQQTSIISSVNFNVQVLFRSDESQSNQTLQIQQEVLEKIIRGKFEQKYLNKGQSFIIDYEGVLKVSASNIKFLEQDLGSEKGSSSTWGRFDQSSEFQFFSIQNRKLKIGSKKLKTNKLFKQNFTFEELGIGGLDKEFSDIFRRAFNSRRYPKSVLDMYGIKHVKGMLLHGPPGTGKTLIARQIAKALDAHEPKIVNGPQIFNKYVGQSEENVRKLFQNAQNQFRARGEESKLHTIILDEIDAICKARGSNSSGTGVSDNVVNQLLSKLDGVDQLPNILVIGMTNRKDLIDQAILRPGRLQVHVEINLPDEEGRVQIFRIHTKAMRENKLLNQNVDLKELASMTKNYSGAQIQAVVRSANSFALFQDAPKLGQKSQNFVQKIVNREHFLKGIEQNRPMFGADDESLQSGKRGGIIDYGTKWRDVVKTCKDFVEQVRKSQKTQLISFLLSGAQGSGKTALASQLGIKSGFPFVKMISPENFVGYSEHAKVAAIVKIFEDSYKSPLSMIILDDIERLIEYIDFGPRFSNTILQTLLVLIKKNPPKAGRNLCIIGTTSRPQVLKQFDILSAFNNILVDMPLIRDIDEINSILGAIVPPEGIRNIQQVLPGRGIGMKQMLLASEMAKQKASEENKDKVDINILIQALNRISGI